MHYSIFNFLILVSNFAKLSNDLKALSVPDLSVLALAYENIKNQNLDKLLRKEPIEYNVVEKEPKEKKEKPKKIEEPVPENEEEEEEDEGEWIGLDNIEKKINNLMITNLEDKENLNPINVYIITGDFTVQNVALKIGIPVMSIDGSRIRKIKNFILKCYACNNFNFDTSRLFCENCGYNTLMKIGYSVDIDGKITINDKKADSRLRGTQVINIFLYQYDLPKPTLSKKGVIYVLSEDQMPKKKNEKFNLEKDLDKVLDNYDSYKDLNNKDDGPKNFNTTKNFVWGYPKKNPNVPKKYYSKKDNK